MKKLIKDTRLNIETLLSKLKSGEFEISKEIIIDILSKSIFSNQFFTPNKIAKLMADLGRINNPNSIIDITCGIGNILSYCDYSQNIRGVDINSDMIDTCQ